MSQVKIYALKLHIDENRVLISQGIHDAIITALHYPKEKKAQRFIPLEKENFFYPDGRTDQYTIIEISMFEGRSTEAKKSLIRQIFKNLTELTNMSEQDIEITIFETPKSNWGIRGMIGDELDLNYKVDV